MPLNNAYTPLTAPAAIQAPFVGMGAGVGDRSAFVGVFDIGQGGFNGVFNADGRPFLYYDMGGGIGGLLFTYPDPAPQFCFSALRMIVQSHFDEDHYKSCLLPAFQANLGGGHRLVIPRQNMGVFGGANLTAVNATGVQIDYWPTAFLASIPLGATGIEIIQCLGNGKNHDGLALRIEDPGAANQWVLLPADAHFDQTIFPWNHGGQNLDGQIVGISPTHHGARQLVDDGMGTIHLPSALGGAVRASAYSFGPGNTHAHPFNEGAHASGDGVQSYVTQGFQDAGRMQTAGRPIDAPNAGPRGSNLGILLSGGAAACLGRDPNVAPGNVAIPPVAIALVASAATAAHQANAASGGAGYASRIPVAAAYQAALEEHRLRPDRPVADYIAQKGVGVAAPIYTAATTAGVMQAWLGACINNGNHSAEAVEHAIAAEPVARALAQLVAEASIDAAVRATTDLLLLVAGHYKTVINDRRRSVLATANIGSQARTDGTNAARALNGPARGIRFFQPMGIAFDPVGNRLLIADTGDSTIVALNYANGASERIAGAPRREGHADGAGIAGRFRKPRGLALNNQLLYVADTENHTIRTVDLTNNDTVATWTGLAQNPGHVDGNAGATRFNKPTGIAFDASANILYVADSANHVLRAIDATPTSSTIAGTVGTAGGIDGAGAAARFHHPEGIALDANGILYVADKDNHTLRKVVPRGGVATLGGAHGVQQSLDGTGLDSRFSRPLGIAADGAGGFFVSDAGSHCIRRVSVNGVVTTVAGQSGAAGHADGNGLAVQFNTPVGLAFDAGTGILWVADAGNHVIRRVDINNAFATTTPFGGVGQAGNTDAANNNARFNAPLGLLLVGTDLLVADSANHIIRRINLNNGQVNTLLGTAGQQGLVDAQGANARFNGPRGLEFDATGFLWIADTGNNRLRVVDNAWNVATRVCAQIGSPVDIVRMNNDLIVLDAANHSVHQVTPGGPVVHVAQVGNVGNAQTVDGRYAVARFSAPAAAVFDAQSGNIVLVDEAAHTLRVLVLRDAFVSTIAGQTGQAGHNDALRSLARFKAPCSVLPLATGDLLVADTGNYVLRNIDAAGTVTTAAGLAGTAGDTDGTAVNSRFRAPSALTRNNNDVYLVDQKSHVARCLTGGNVSSMPDIVVSEALASYALTHGNVGAPMAYPLALAIATAADAFCAAAAHAYCAALSLGFGETANAVGAGGVLTPARQPPEASAIAHGLLAPIANVEAALLVAIAAAAALGPAVEVQTTGVVVPGVALDAPGFEKRLVTAAVAALVGMRQAVGTGPDNARAAVAAARAATAAARGAPLVGCHRHPSSCGAAFCSLTIHEFC